MLKCEIWESSILRLFLLATVKKDALIIPSPWLAYFNNPDSPGKFRDFIHGGPAMEVRQSAVRYIWK